MKHTPLFPLVKLAPLGFLTAAALIGALFVFRSPRFVDAEYYWAASSLLPLIIYLAFCHLLARKIVLAEQGRERDIVKMELVAIAAERYARFWGFLFGIITIATCATAMAVWAYQAWVWHSEGQWVPFTWLSTAVLVPQPEHAYLQRSFHWLADTNMGVIVLIAGLLVAAPLAAVHRESGHQAKLRRKDLVNLKKRS